MTDSRELRAGRRLGPYEVVRRIGAGGMGTVYEGRDTRLGRPVAIKCAAAPFSGRLEREARAISALNHPHICTLHDIVEEGDEAYLVMEFVEGRTLADRLQEGALPDSEILRYGAEIAGALAAAHARGIIHRDLKPANIMLTADGVKVLDFGLAKVTTPAADDAPTQTLTAPQTILGTLQYMAPEQLEGKECDERADIFALGLVLYEMAAGRTAFAADSRAGLIAEIIRCEPEPLCAGTPQFRRTVRRCLAKDPAKRWHSAADVRIDLEEPPAAGELAASAPAPVRPKRLVAWAAAAAGLLAGFLAATFWRVEPLAFPVVTPFATEFAVQTMPSWSPKGDRIAYVAEVDGIFQVFTKGLSPSTPTQRTRLNGPCHSPFWSSDGNRVYFFHRGAMWFVPAAGGLPEKALEPARHAALSADGQRMAVMQQRLGFAAPPGTAPLLYDLLKAQDIAFPHLEYTRDGKYLGQSGLEQGRVIFRKIPANGGPPREFRIAAMGFMDAFTWLPGANRLVIAGVPSELGRRANDFRIGLWDLDSGQFRHLTDNTSQSEFPVLSPDGETLTYAQGRHDYDLIEVPLDNSGAVRSVLETSRNELAPCWSPNGTHFAYATDRSGHYEMRLRDRRDSSERVIVADSDFGPESLIFYGCSFAPDGQRLAIDTYSQGTYGVWIAALSGEAPVPALTQLPGAPRTAWSPDGRWIAYVGSLRGKPALMKIAVGGREPQFITERTGTRGGPPQWSPDGGWIVHEDGTGVHAVSLDGQQKRTISAHPWLGFGWLKGGSALCGIYGDPERRLRLGRIDFATARETLMADLGPKLADTGTIAHGHSPYLGFSMSPDGQSALTSVLRLNKAIYLMRDFDRPARLIDRLWKR